VKVLQVDCVRGIVFRAHDSCS